MSTKRKTRPPAGDNLEFIFPDEPEGDVVEHATVDDLVQPVQVAAAPPCDDEVDASDDDTEDVEEEYAEGEEEGESEEDEDESEDEDEDEDEDESDSEDEEEEEEEDESDSEDEDDEGEDEDDSEEDDEDEDEDDSEEEDDEDEDEDDSEEEDDEDEDEDDSEEEDDEDEDEDEDEDDSEEEDAADDSDDDADSEDEDAALLDADLEYETDDDPGAEVTDDWGHELEALETPKPVHAPRVLHVEDVMSHSHGLGTIARSLLAIVALHALLALSIRVAPSYASTWLSHIPLAGRLLAREPTLMQHVELRNVAGTFQELRNARRVFVITGEAVNRSPASVERIEVEATLYNGEGRVDRKVVSAGNRTMLRDLSEKEIALLQRLDPRRVVEPGESSTFLIVFLEPPGTVLEFSSRVLNVRPTRRLARPATKDRPDSPGSVG